MGSLIIGQFPSSEPSIGSIGKKDRSIPMLPEDTPENNWNLRTGFEIERDRLAAKGLPMPVRDGTQGE